MTIRCRLVIRGQVQGVGFRPFVYRLATELGLTGFVRNDNRGVVLEIEGYSDKVLQFERRLPAELKLPARIDSLERETLAPICDPVFVILPSDPSGSKETTVLSDIAPCAACLAEMRDPGNRRYRYPFTNCTHCGPRFTIIDAVPYDRPNTTMRGFVQCEQCHAEYHDPLDRRFHAQPNACPQCGPQLSLLAPNGVTLAERDGALREAQSHLKNGKIVAVFGIGGFQLLVNAENHEAVETLRKRKHRFEKPLAVMVESAHDAAQLVELDETAIALLRSPEAPIVLLPKCRNLKLSEAVAPDNSRLGVMLPSSPLHHLLLSDLGFPVVATSGNLSEEPICVSTEEALSRLASIADSFLVHNRPIVRHVDDSVLSLTDDEPKVIRRARGFAPLPILLRERMPQVLALGGHLKNTIALTVGDRCFVSQHIGDLDSLETRNAHLRVIEDFLRLYDARPEAVAHDLHSDYASTHVAEMLTQKGGLLAGVPRIAVQHHHAHLASCLADAGSDERTLGVIWDGTGLGTDGHIWGGEFLLGNADGYERVAALLPFRLPGGDSSARSPRRIALSLLLQHFSEQTLIESSLDCLKCTEEREVRILAAQIKKPHLAPLTSSMGRLFDAMASLLGLTQDATFEGQAAMAVEHAADRSHGDAYAFTARAVSPRPITPDNPGVYLDPAPVLHSAMTDRTARIPISVIAARFHNALANAVLSVAQRFEAPFVALSGGCFQNRLLAERCRDLLQRNGHEVILHRQIPPNDGGLALGQVAVACSRLRRSPSEGKTTCA